jgi:succinylarginine dihydrolase
MSIQSVVRELNFDCLVGPTHFFGGLSLGNLASSSNKYRLSNPKKAALQGLNKMRYLNQRGFLQAVLLPHYRPDLETLRTIGFSGSSQNILQDAHKYMPELLLKLYSSSAMWAANAATVCPKKDAQDNKTHLTPANLATLFHRSIEACFTKRLFNKIFEDKRLFTIHDPLPSHDIFSDEGAANHNILCPDYNSRGLHIFIYGKESSMLNKPTKIYPARQSRLASEALARNHQLDQSQVIIWPQNPEAIDAGAFHNDVVCVANQQVFLCHEKAFENQEELINNITRKYQLLNNKKACIITIKNNILPIKDAVSSYLFNSQLLTKADMSMMLFAPLESQNNPHAQKAMSEIIQKDNPINEVVYFDLSESMANGGGPACLRLRVPLTTEELNSLRPSIFMNENTYEKLAEIINKYYINNLTIEHLLDTKFLQYSQEALDQISQVLGLYPIYDWQF